MLTTETAIVTGASQGIGAGLVTRFLEKVFNVVGNSRAINVAYCSSTAAAGSI
jgi:NAD(P)-dependent dehydrogenase (short-subunit alcohol dehydrogenase family)